MVRSVISGGADGTLILWDVATGRTIGQPWQGHKNTINSVAFSHDGKYVISCSTNHFMILWNVATGRPIGPPWYTTLQGCTNSHQNTQWHEEGMTDVAFSYDGQYVVSGSKYRDSFYETNGVLIQWNVVTGQPIGQAWWVPMSTIYN